VPPPVVQFVEKVEITPVEKLTIKLFCPYKPRSAYMDELIPCNP